jgi:hypothetical protein
MTAHHLNGVVMIAWAARDTWLVIEAATVAGLLTTAAFWARARRRGINKARNNQYRRSFWGLAAWVTLNAARLASHRYR